MPELGTEKLAIRAVSALYEAALDESFWPEALAAVRAFMGGSNPAFAYRRFSLELVGICPETEPYWHRRIAELPLDSNLVWREQLLRPAGSVLVDNQLVDPTELRRSMFYNEIVLPQGYHSTLHVNLAPHGRGAAYFCLGRQHGRPAFEQTDVERFHLLMPAFARAARIFAGIDPASRRDTVDEFSDLPSKAVFTIGHNGAVLSASPTGWELVERPDSPLRLTHGRIWAADAAANRRLRKAVYNACDDDALSPNAHGDDIAVRRKGRLAGMLSVFPYRSHGNDARDKAVLIWFPVAGSPDARLGDRLRRLFGLTPREAELAVALLSQPSLRAAGESLAIGFNTARTHLQRIMDKTDTHSQNALIRLLGALDG